MSLHGRVVVRQAPAKINLTLRVTGRRADRYHSLESDVAFALLHDTVRVELREQGVSLEIDGPEAGSLAAEPADTNLVARVAASLAEAASVRKGVHVILTKRIPIAAGLGGGSADAAAALGALASLWDLDRDSVLMPAIAAGLGADVPVCWHGRAARVTGIGDEIGEAVRLPISPVLLVNPRVALSTPAVFRAYAGTKRIPADGSGNDLTEAAVGLAPVVGEVLASLCRQKGRISGGMSGSGATCFARFEDPDAMIAAARLLRAENPGWWIAPTWLTDDPGRIFADRPMIDAKCHLDRRSRLA